MTLSDLLKTTRQYFWSRSFTEIEPTYLNSSLPLEPNLFAYQTDKFFLPTSPEVFLKKHLSEHNTDCFSISHCFRQLERTGPHHKPEFLMLEYYLVNQDLAALQQSVQDFVSKFLNSKFLNLKLPSGNFSNEPDFNQFFLNEIEPTLPKNKAVFITGYPAFLSPLAKISPPVIARSSDKVGTTRQSLRFELYINGIEVANGCEENTDGEQIKTAFKTEQKYRQTNDLPTHPISEDFIKHCSSLSPCSGVGIGLDRLLMIINNQQQL